MMPARYGRSADTVLRCLVWCGAALLLALPWIAMRYTQEVRWDGRDFAAFGLMLLAACVACELALRASPHWATRLGAGLAIGTAFLTVWANLAVGMIGDARDPANLLFAGVLLVALAGTIRARGRARGMGLAMRATALAQALATGLALAWSGWDVGALPALCFALAWLGSAQLYRLGAAHEAVPGR